MVYRKAKQQARRAYSCGKSIFSGKIFKNSIIVGLAAGLAKNTISGKKIIDVEDIKMRISKIDGTNPLIFLLLGIISKNPTLAAIGAYAVIDPPGVEEKKEHVEYTNVGENGKTAEYSNIEENEETTEYSNIEESEEKDVKKRCIH